MGENYGFGKYEGYVGKKDNFNGIIFYLREPNNEGENTKSFWFKRIITDKENYYKELEAAQCRKIATDKRTASKFIHRFREMFEQLDLSEKKLQDTVFCNVNPNSGNKNVGNEYYEAFPHAAEKLETIVTNMDKKKLIVFTCEDIFQKLYYSWKVDKIYEDGLKYQNKPRLHYFEHTISNKESKIKVRVYEIIHPSRSPRLQKLR